MTDITGKVKVLAMLSKFNGNNWDLWYSKGNISYINKTEYVPYDVGANQGNHIYVIFIIETLEHFCLMSKTPQSAFLIWFCLLLLNSSIENHLWGRYTTSMIIHCCIVLIKRELIKWDIFF